MSCEEPKSKKVKTEAYEEEVPSDEENVDADVAPVAALKNDAGEAFFELSSKKRVTIREFKGNKLVDIREVYEKGGKMLPGKKGISLTIDQYEAFKDLVVGGHIDKAIEEM
mmetsp:Transcript_31811/g.49338  ORF Transcript_31811/g.49338 Transcript_31811/m.49338 type:complete len:111 (-) Transcript_31811:362-694(-)